MALLAGQPAFVGQLLANDKRNYTSSAEAAEKFADAFITWMYTSMVGVIPALPVGLQANRAAFIAALIPAFEAKDPISHCGLFQVAVMALLLTGSTIWTGVSAIVPSPLVAILPPVTTVLQSDDAVAKNILATAYIAWFAGFACTVGSATVPIT